jgi:hypothetical protein
MNRYQVRFIRSLKDDDGKHLVIEVDADSFDEAREAARENARANNIWLAQYGYDSIEVKRFGANPH